MVGVNTDCPSLVGSASLEQTVARTTCYLIEHVRLVVTGLGQAQLFHLSGVRPRTNSSLNDLHAGIIILYAVDVAGNEVSDNGVIHADVNRNHFAGAHRSSHHADKVRTLVLSIEDAGHVLGHCSRVHFGVKNDELDIGVIFRNGDAVVSIGRRSDDILVALVDRVEDVVVVLVCFGGVAGLNGLGLPAIGCQLFDTTLARITEGFVAEVADDVGDFALRARSGRGRRSGAATSRGRGCGRRGLAATAGCQRNGHGCHQEDGY
ncbi:hypothetical protein SDC9_139791 [bioreactor metagenome]|uniref:Uncharacterized protein n=1 Tax=bioreactor metagenome TaxID=1076179 RepID=A0A645DTJ2_9ZZZZ